MRILFISKRQYTNKDLLDDQFGRYWHIPVELSHLGHEVLFLCLSYEKKVEGWHLNQGNNSTPKWYSFNAGRIPVLGFIRFAIRSLLISRDFNPDLIVGGSDTLYGILGNWLARRQKIPFVYDLYDNYAAFAAYRLPVVAGLYGQALQRANMVTCVSQPLVELVRDEFHRTGPVMMVNNGVTDDFFDLTDKQNARKLFELPKHKKLVGIVGAISSSRGFDVIFEAFSRVHNIDNNIILVLAGPVSDVTIPEDVDIIYLGVLPHEKVPDLLHALDLVIVPLIPSVFCDYCFPLKFLEAVASKTPVIAANVGVLNSILSNSPSCIYSHDDPGSLVEKMLLQLQDPVIPEFPVARWNQVAKLFEKILFNASARLETKNQ